MEWILVKIRLKQLSRELDAMGFFYALFYLGLAGFFILLSYKLYQDREKAFLWSAAIVSIISYIHLNRADKQFVFLHLQKPAVSIFMEYFIFTLPFTLPALFTKQYYCFILIQLFNYFLAGLNLKAYDWKPKISPSAFIDPANFELISGFRRYFIAFAIIYLLAIGFSWLSFLPLFFLWLLTTLIMSFYGECESLNLLRVYGETPAEFLKRKIWNQYKVTVLLFSPVLVINMFFNTGFWFVNIIFLFLQLIILAFAILFKYSTYEPDKNITGSGIIPSLVSVSGFIPFLIPIPLILCFRNYRIAKRNLKKYLYA